MTGRYVGARVMRGRGSAVPAGRGVYLDDIEPAGTLHVAFLRSPHAHARIVSVDSARASALEGVALVVTGEDLRDLPPFTTTIATRPETKTGTRRMLPIERVRFVGEAVAAVVARSRAIAEDAAELIDVEYERLPAVLDAEAALAPGAPVLHDELGDNNFAHIEFEAGDVDGAFAGRRARLPQALPLRPLPRSAARGPGRDRRLGRRRGIGDGLDVDADAVPRARHARRAVRARRHARARHLPRGRGRLRPQGAALRRGGDHPRAVAPPRQPVKWVEDHYEALAASGHSKEVICELALATDADGRFLRSRAITWATAARTSRIRGRVSSTRSARPRSCPGCTPSRTSATRSTRRSRTSASRRRTAASAGRRGRRRARR